MKNRSVFIMFSAAIITIFALGMTAEAKGPKHKGPKHNRPPSYLCKNGESDGPAGIPQCASDECTPSKIQNGDCTLIRDRFGTFTGYIVTNSSFTARPSATIIEYEICVAEGFCPKDISHVDLELPICIGENEEKTRCDVLDATDEYEVFKDGRGDPSTGFLKWFVADLLKIDEGVATVANFFVKVDGEAYRTRGSVGLKFGPEMFTGDITVPVCSIDCGLTTFASASGTGPAEERDIVETADGYQFEIECFENGCCKVLRCFKPGPEGGWKEPCNNRSFETFFEANKDGQSNMVEDISDGESQCINLVVDDESESSPSYCSGGTCWYW